MSDRGVRGVDRAGGYWIGCVMAYIGAAIYFVSQSDGTFWGVVLGLLKALVWPVYLVYSVLLTLGA